MNKEGFIKKWKYRTINNGFTSEIYDCEKELRTDLNELEKDNSNTLNAINLLQEVKDGFLNPLAKIDKAISLLKL